MSTLKKLSLLLVALSVMFGALGATASPAAASPTEEVTCRLWHTVEKGEYLSKIARLYDTNWRRIVEINNLQKSRKLNPGLKLCIFTSSSSSSTTPAVISDNGLSQRVSASSVEEDKSVTLVGKNLIASTRYSVYLSWVGIRNTQAFLVGTSLTDKAGAFTDTYKIPKMLADRVKIYIYVTNGRGDSASNWFINATAKKGSTGGVSMAPPSLKVTEVKRGQVQIKVTSLPANIPFNVYIGKAGSKGIGGVKVGTVENDDGGQLKATFDIPSSLSDRSKLDIRLENKKLGISTYLTFEK